MNKYSAADTIQRVGVGVLRGNCIKYPKSRELECRQPTGSRCIILKNTLKIVTIPQNSLTKSIQVLF